MEQLQEQRKAPIEASGPKQKVWGFLLHKSDSEGLYYLAKEEPVSGKSSSVRVPT